MDFVGDRIQPAAECIMGLYATFTGCDCTMVEINPLAELTDGRVIACDAKVARARDTVPVIRLCETAKKWTRRRPHSICT